MAGTNHIKGLRRRRRRSGAEGEFSSNPKRGRVIAAWSTLFTLVALGVIGSAAFLWIKKGDRPQGASERQHSTVKEVASRFPSPSEKVALGIVSKAWQADTVEAIATYFKLDGTTPAAALEKINEIRHAVGTEVHYQWLGSTDRNGLLIDTVLFRSDSEAGLSPRFVFLTPNNSGIWKVDFHAFARTNTPDWSEISQPTSKGGVVRVILGKDTYYNGVFADESAWACYALTGRGDDEVPALGYCRKGTPQQVALGRIIQRATMEDILQIPPHAVLKISRVAGAETKQFEITRVLAEGWVMGPTPFDEGQ